MTAADVGPRLVAELLPLLRCTRCRGGDLVLGPGAAGIRLPFPVRPEAVNCPWCGESFPLTEDFIPLLWTPALRGLLEGEPGQPRNLAANVEVYDAISDDYGVRTRQAPELARRVRTAAERLLSPGAKRHLDFGCGPGHVLGWLRELGLEQVGLDVSLNNLRNARRSTGALVVWGDATCMPFADGAFDLVTESSVLHHIEDWRAVLREACRVCGPGGGVVLDSEPSEEGMAWGPVARAVFEARFPAYRLLSYLMPSKYVFRDPQQARRNLLAEIHHQPGGGFPLAELEELLRRGGLEPEVVVSPTPDLTSRASPSWQKIVLNLLSSRNPWNPRYGAFTALARRPAAR